MNKNIYESIMDKITLQMKKLNESEEIPENVIIDKSKIKAVEIKNIDQLINIVKNSYPDESTDTGFWLFYNALKKDYRTYGSINKKPWYVRYIVYLYDGIAVAMKCFSTEYYNVNPDPKFKNYVRYLNFQVDSDYRGNNLQVYLNRKFEEAIKKAGYKGITMMCYEPSLQQKYIRDGYQGNQNLMWKTF